ncbi:MAG: 4Fe-4S dicluster domain-containing protein [Paracoccaceae bacterium]
MPKANPYRPFTPDPEQTALWPEISGNAVNGLGESAFRRPDVVYWAPNPPDIPHGDLQLWFYTQDPGNPRFAEVRAWRKEILEAPLPDVTGSPAKRSPEDWTADLSRFVDDGACEMTGVAEMDPDWVFADEHVAQSRIIIVGVQHDYAEIAKAPDSAAGAEVMHQYGRAAAASKAIAGWLRLQGWDAEPLTGPMTSKVAMIPPAIACGFGELGKHGSIINPEFGASFRLSAVLTDAPFAVTPQRDFGIDNFCQSCRICEDACPPEALFPDKKTVRGAEKWYVDFGRCLPFFNQTQGCAICIAECPWSRPGIGMSLAAKLARRTDRLSRSSA